jgi:hypothetical protein
MFIATPIATKVLHFVQQLTDTVRMPRPLRPNSSDPREIDKFYREQYSPRRKVGASNWKFR